MNSPDSPLPLSARAFGAMAARPAPYLDGLNPAQRAGGRGAGWPCADAGRRGHRQDPGADRAHRASADHRAARPNEILAVTFTNKAAREMKDRVGRLLGEAVEGMPWLGTFHSIGVKLLRRHAELVGLKSNFTILDTDDQLRLMKQVIAAANLDEKRWPARQLGRADRWLEEPRLDARAGAIAEAPAFNNRGTELYAAYQDRLAQPERLRFRRPAAALRDDLPDPPDVLAQYQRWFRYILVDEYQDTNVAQYLWLRLLAQGHRNICCVGDDDQSIYGWRGAEVGNILRFEKDFPGAAGGAAGTELPLHPAYPCRRQRA
jgi:DNA helicase II / ATP-dependent DNA helicase PcrA